MPFLDPIPQNEPSRADQAISLVNKIIVAEATTVETVITRYESDFKEVWYNETFTPLEMLTAYGTRAYSLFEKAALTISYIQALKPDYVPPVQPATVTFKLDGPVDANGNPTQGSVDTITFNQQTDATNTTNN